MYIDPNKNEVTSTIPVLKPEQVERTTEFQIVWRNFRKNRGAVLGLIILTAMISIAILAEPLAPFDPIEQTRDFLQGPSEIHPFGTDTLGRDNFSRVLFGARISMGVGVGAVLISLVVGLFLGITGGYFGRWVDAIIVMVIDSFMAFPGLLLALVIAALLGPSLVNVMFAVGLGNFTMFARLVRSTVYVEKGKDYILAARSLGARSPLIIILHILPNIVPPLIVLTTLTIGSSILTAASLGYLGLGAQPPTPEWGNMVNIGRDYLQIAPWLIWFPGLAIMLTVLASNLMGDGLRDALDPKLRR